MDIAQNLRRVLEQRGLSANAASKKAGLPRDAISDILNGRSEFPRANTLMAIARALDVDPAVILVGSNTDNSSVGSAIGANEVLLPVRFEVAAGMWKEVEDYHDQLEAETKYVPQIAAYIGVPQWLERVIGDSMDRLVPPNSLVHVVDTIALEYEPRQDDVVVVQRSRSQGALVERSLKQVALNDGIIELWPRSHSGRWTKPIPLSADDGSDDEVVQVVGIVIRAYMDFDKRE